MTIFYNSNIDTQTEVKQKEVQELEKPSLSEEMKKLNLEEKKDLYIVINYILKEPY